MKPSLFSAAKLPLLSAAILCAIAVTTLSGCDDIDGRDYFNSSETILYKQCESQTKNLRAVSCSSYYKQTIKAAPQLSERNSENLPFKNQGITFIIEDRAFKDNNPNLLSMNEFWHKYTGEWLYNVPDASQAGDVKKVDERYVLSPQMYDELISAVRTCNRATVESMQFKAGATLTPEQYDKVMNIIIECKSYQLEKAINEK